ncbi:glycine cleavage system aminomethyltransferase GcvT [Rickettsiales bacterium]|nr:glycine cleavage system aminomethyltransferase GcvT [Rickettsiales bacterium]
MNNIIKKTSLNQTHKDQKGKMVEFAGYEMPVEYSLGMLKEHEWVRNDNVGLFDVSHMGQITIEGENAAEFLTKLTPSNFKIAKNNLAKYTVLTNENGGIIDDLIITKIAEDKFFIVINAGCKEKDIAWFEKNLPENLTLTRLDDRSLIAIQGIKAEEILQNFISKGNLSELPYMNLGNFTLQNGEEVYISRTGYTGEDGFEVSIKDSAASAFWLQLCQNDFVQPIGLGARDTLRLEMGYPLYGHDLNEETSPVEAGLSWVVSKTNDNFFGSDRIIPEKANGAKIKRVGIKLLERGIAREGAEIEKDGQVIGKLTSGGFSPALKTSIGQAYLNSDIAINGEKLNIIVRNRKILAEICSPNFLPARTKSKK